LVETLLAALAAADELAPDRSDRTRKANSLIVKVAEDYALSHAGEPLYVSDLCSAAAVSERTLEYAFKEAMGLRPMAYLIRLRLHRVREALLAGTPGSTTVSEPESFSDFDRAGLPAGNGGDLDGGQHVLIADAAFRRTQPA
jgi:AraC-like DNA-binding protein